MLAQNLYKEMAPKTASYTILPEDIGKKFTNRGATAAITFTLPIVANLKSGWWCEFYGVSATGFVVASNGSADNIVALNDAGADTLTVTTTSLIIGAHLKMTWDGTGWLSERGAGNTFAVA